MKRTIALVLSLLFLLVLVPSTALADNNDVEARLVVTVPDATQTLFQYGVENFNWTSPSLVVTLYDKLTNSGGTVLPTMGSTIASDTYVLLVDGNAYDPATPYEFKAAELGKRTVTVKYSYTPDGHSATVTVTKDLTISVQQNILTSLTASGSVLKDYYAGETLNTSGLVVAANYSNTVEPKTLTSADYTITAASDLAGTDEILSTAPLTTLQTMLVVSRTEKYEGSTYEVIKKGSIPITVTAAADKLILDASTLDLFVDSGTTTVNATASLLGSDISPACLVASVDKPAVAAIDTSLLTSGSFTIEPLSVGTAIVTVRTRGSNISQTVVVNVSKQPVPVDALVLDKSSLSLPVNGTYSFTATVGPDDATNKTLTWTSSSESDVSVDNVTGTIKVLRNFSTPVIIKAASVSQPGVFAICEVTVNTVAVDGIYISETGITLYKDSWKKLTAVIVPSGAADPAVTWTSNNINVATVDATGKITAVGIPSGEEYGEAIITAQSSNSLVKETCTVKVLPAVLITSLTLNKSDVAMNVGDEETLTVTGTPTNATNKTIEWLSSNPAVASVTSTGKVIAAGKGTTVIKAKSTDGSDKYASCVVTVNNIQILNIYLDKSSFDLSEGDTAAVKATLYPTNATTQTIKWTSSNTSVATVDSKGNITAGATKGYAIITAAATDGSGKYAECVVLSKPKVYVTGVTINYGTTLDLLLNDSTYLKATILPTNATTQTATWTTSDATVASIDASGLLKGLKLGEATITATADTKTVTIKVTVTNTEYNYGVAGNFKRRVNVRASASGLSKNVGYAYRGDTFKILGKTGNWYYI